MAISCKGQALLSNTSQGAPAAAGVTTAGAQPPPAAWVEDRPRAGAMGGAILTAPETGATQRQIYMLKVPCSY